MTCLMGLVLYVLGQRLQVYGNEIGTAGNSSVLMAFGRWWPHWRQRCSCASISARAVWRALPLV